MNQAYMGVQYQLVGNSIIALIFIACVSIMYNTFNNLSIKEGRKEWRKEVCFVCHIEISQTIVLSKALWVLLLKGPQWVGGGGVHWCDFVMLRLMVQELLNIG
jgi:hypothetical protein